MDERRRFFRISDTALLNFRVIQPEVMDQGIRALSSDLDARQHLEHVFLGMDARLHELHAAMNRESPALTEAIDLINKKLGFVERLVIGQGSPSAAEPDEAHLLQSEVNLSASGMALRSPGPIAADAFLEIELVLLSGHKFLKAYARVVDCRDCGAEEGEQRYEVAVDFEFIRDEDRELLIQHILKKQAVQLRNERSATAV
jgi:c-di-GMP-binding flagellar brake protein YcgR